MRKILIIMTMGLLLTQTMTAQVHDEEKYLQWRSMETGPLEFAPKMYYYLFHNSYAHHRWEWEWHGFKSGLYLHLKANPRCYNRLMDEGIDGLTGKGLQASAGARNLGCSRPQGGCCLSAIQR